MKECPNCQKIYVDEATFCSICGYRLKPQESPNKKNIIAILFVSLAVIIGIGLSVSELNTIKNKRAEIDNYKHNKVLQEYQNTPTTSDIEINSNWSTIKDGKYIYILGTVTNTSKFKTISYFEIEAKFYDRHGNIIDSEWTNDGDDLAPGESRSFEIMHKYSLAESDIKLFVKDVR